MEVLYGAALVGLTLYASILSYALRSVSRSRLAERLPEAQRREWIDWLIHHERTLLGIVSFVRLAAILLLLDFGYMEFVFRGDAAAEPWLRLRLLVTNLAILLVLAVGVPHALAAHAGAGILSRSLRLLRASRYVFYPIERLLGGLDFLIRRLLGRPDEDAAVEAERVEQEVLETVSEGELAGAIDEEQREMIESVFELHETAVSEIMTPRTDIVAVPVEADYEQVRRTIVQAGHSRLPVYEESLDRILGVLYVKDLFRLDPEQPFDLREIIRSVPFVPETKTIDDLLREFRQMRVHIAIVLDEYGGTSGLVTIEDILEELVGEIDDEYDRRSAPEIRRIDERTIEVDARAHVYEVNEALGSAIPENGEYETIAGFVFTRMGRIPRPGESLDFDGLHFEVLDAEPRRIRRLRIRISEPREASGAAGGRAR